MTIDTRKAKNFRAKDQGVSSLQRCLLGEGVSPVVASGCSTRLLWDLEEMKTKSRVHSCPLPRLLLCRLELFWIF